MKKLFALAVVAMLSVAACGGDSDTTPRAFETPLTDELGLRPLLDEAKELVGEMSSVLLGPSVEKVLAASSNVVDVVRDMDLTKRTSDRAVTLAQRIAHDVGRLLGGDELAGLDETLQGISDALDNAGDPEAIKQASQTSTDLVSDATRWDPDLYSRISAQVDKLVTILERSGTDDQLAMVRQWASEFTQNLDDVGAKLDKVSTLGAELVAKIQTILDRLPPP